MKLEDQIKQSLNKHEEAFNPAAWDAMKAKLDAQFPVAHQKGNSNWWIAAGMIVVAITSLIIWNNSTKTTNQIAKQNQKSVSEDSGRKESTSKINPQSTPTNTTGNPLTENQSIENKKQDTDNQHLSQDKDSENAMNDFKKSDNLTKESKETSIQTATGTPLVVDEIKKADPVQFTKFKTTINQLCLGENLIKNIDNRTLVILDENKNTIAKIEGGKSENVTISKAGMVHLGYHIDWKYKNIKSIKIDEISEISYQQIDEDIKFENGIPVVKFISDDNLTWTANGQSFSGKEAKFNFYQSGNQIIKLTKKTGQCSVSKTISVPVEKYNLLAPTAFNPNGFNKTFLPEALKLRNVDFRMTIIDMSNGGLVYETTNSNLPWDGVDIRTGRIAKEPIKYAWKVQLMNPEKGEPELYQGTVRKL